MMQRDKKGTHKGHPICVCRFIPSCSCLPHVSDGGASGAGSAISHSVTLSVQIDHQVVYPEHPVRALVETCFFRMLDP
jgi:hypothetical protein